MKPCLYMFFTTFALFLSMNAFGQYDRYFYEWSPSANVESVTTNIPGDVVFKSWESNSFLFEYHIKVSNVPRATFLALLKTPRYQLQSDLQGTQLKLAVDDGAFRTFISDVGQAIEEIVLTVYHPEEFTANGEQLSLK